MFSPPGLAQTSVVFNLSFYCLKVVFPFSIEIKPLFSASPCTTCPCYKATWGWGLGFPRKLQQGQDWGGGDWASVCADPGSSVH